MKIPKQNHGVALRCFSFWNSLGPRGPGCIIAGETWKSDGVLSESALEGYQNDEYERLHIISETYQYIVRIYI